jgi:hypothetical protein
MRRDGDDDDAGLAELEPSDAMMHADPRARPVFTGLVEDPAQRTHGQRLVRFVLEI